MLFNSVLTYKRGGMGLFEDVLEVEWEISKTSLTRLLQVEDKKPLNQANIGLLFIGYFLIMMFRVKYHKL